MRRIFWGEGWVRSGKRLLPLAVGTVFAGCCYGQEPNLTVQATTITSGTKPYQASNTITNAGQFTVGGSATVTFTAGSSITLTNGFHAGPGSAAVTFHAVISTSAVGQPTTTYPATGAPSKEYIYSNGKLVAIENPH